MRLPPHVREPVLSSIPAPATSRRGLCFSQVMPFSYVSQRNKQPGENGTVRFDAIARRRACSTLARVARVSRLIGNSDSTGKAYQWQVCAFGGSVFGNRSPKAIPNTGNATLTASGVLILLHWSLAPGKWRAVAVSTALSMGFPVGFSLLRAAHWRLLFPGALCCFGSLIFS